VEASELQYNQNIKDLNFRNQNTYKPAYKNRNLGRQEGDTAIVSLYLESVSCI